jgi:acetyl-CoA acyltransferase 2
MPPAVSASAAKNVFIVAAKRTPFGAFGGSLKDLTATELGVVATKAALGQAPQLDPSVVDEIYFGNVIQSSREAAYLARHVGLQSGFPIRQSALTLNRLCGSGFETVIQASKSIQLGQAHVVVAGGTENMSNAPLVVYGNMARWGVALGKGWQAGDALWDGLTDVYAGTPMGVTAENLAQKYGISRAECDEYAIRSQQLWAEAKKKGIFDAEIAPVTVKGKKGEMVVDTDEHPRPQSTLEGLAKLKPVFAKDGTVTAANASGICDGAGSVIVVSEEALKEYNLTPLCRLAGYAVAGCDPKIMGIGPVPAIQQALEKSGMTLGQVDRVEINEAFAAQFLACAKELELDMSKTNIHGGAISLGHPLGASGSRITAHLANEFARTDGKIHVGAACIGGGQGIAVVLERV